MNEESTPRPTPRKPVIVRPGPRPAAPVGAVRPVAATRVIPAPGATRPAPGSLIRSLVATRGWANIDAFAFIIFGLLAVARAAQKWIHLTESWRKLNVDTSSREVILVRVELVFWYVFGGGCLLAALKLFRYSSAITRLRQASRMQELEKAFRHQRTVWIVLGTVGALWLLLFTSQLVSLVIGLNEVENEEAEMTGGMPQD